MKSASNNATCSPLNDPILFRLEKAYMRGGRRQLSQNMLVSVTEKIKALQLPRYYKASEEKREAIPTDPVEIIKKAIENARPLMGIQKVQVGGVSYNVPVPIQESRYEIRLSVRLDPGPMSYMTYFYLLLLFLEPFSTP